MQHDTLKNSIMRRVYIVHAVRRVLSGTMLRLYALVALMLGLAASVSVRDVIANIPGESVGALYNFFTYAALHTDTVVQLMLIAAALIALLFARDLIRSIAHTGALHRAA